MARQNVIEKEPAWKKCLRWFKTILRCIPMVFVIAFWPLILYLSVENTDIIFGFSLTQIILILILQIQSMVRNNKSLYERNKDIIVEEINKSEEQLIQVGSINKGNIKENHEKGENIDD